MPPGFLRTVVRCSLVLALSGAAAAFAGTSTATNPVVTFTSPGTKQVSLQACNSGGCNTAVKSVTVLNPMPAVASFDATPNPVMQGDVVHLTGVGNGAPVLTYTWRILDLSGAQVATLSGPSADWTVDVAPGLYSVYIDLSNSHGVNTPAPAVVTVLISSYIFSDSFEQGNTNLWLESP